MIMRVLTSMTTIWSVTDDDEFGEAVSPETRNLFFCPHSNHFRTILYVELLSLYSQWT